MAVTISRLYDRYADAERAVTALESAGIPNSDISIVANNSDEWYSGNKDRDGDGVDDARKAPAREPELAPGLGVRLDYLLALDCLQSQGWVRW
jgi:hypothetical protein